MKFVTSYSGGKDSILALYRAITAGHEPVALLTTCDESSEHSWFHNIPYPVLDKVSNSLNIPIVLVKTKGDRYANDFENALLKLKDKGAEMCVFGDIDIQEHYDWCNNRCVNAGIKSYFPLWKEERKNLVHEFVDSGFQATVTVINTLKMKEKYIGRKLTKQLITELEADGTDVCGENGEYHTFVTDGCIFNEKIKLKFGEAIKHKNYVSLPILGVSQKHHKYANYRIAKTAGFRMSGSRARASLRGIGGSAHKVLIFKSFECAKIGGAK